MSQEYNNGWDAGVVWAKANWYNSAIGKNCDGGLLGRKIASLRGSFQAGFAEGVRYALANPHKV